MAYRPQSGMLRLGVADVLPLCHANTMRLPLLAFCVFSIVASSAACAQDPPEFALVNPFPNLTFSLPVGLEHAHDGTNTLYVVEQAGRIRSFENDENTPSHTTFLDISSRVSFGGESGLLGLAFDPDFENNGYFYVDYYTTGSPRTRISRFSLDENNPEVGDPASEEILIEIGQPFSNHNAGQIAFGPDGYLYVTLGDGGSGGDPLNHGQRPTTLLGSILRLDVHGGGDPLDCGAGTGSATIPADNPLVDGTGNVCDEVYAYGMRNPWRMTLDPETNEFWIGDVGQNAWEEIDILAPGANYGWKKYEGTHCFSAPCDPAGMTFPIWEYPHSNGNFSVAGGYVYRGLAIPEFAGKYIYGDLGGRIWSLDTSGPSPVNEEIGSVDESQYCDFSYCLTSFGLDERGEVYVLTVDGPIRKFIRVPATIDEEVPSTPSPSLDIHGPNPVSDQTSMRIQSPMGGHALLAVFDMLGREVVRLYDDVLRASSVQEVTFDSSNLPAGTYMARLITDGTVETRKLTVAR